MRTTYSFLLLLGMRAVISSSTAHSTSIDTTFSTDIDTASLTDIDATASTSAPSSLSTKDTSSLISSTTSTASTSTVYLSSPNTESPSNLDALVIGLSVGLSFLLIIVFIVGLGGLLIVRGRRQKNRENDGLSVHSETDHGFSFQINRKTFNTNEDLKENSHTHIDIMCDSISNQSENDSYQITRNNWTSMCQALGEIGTYKFGRPRLKLSDSCCRP